MRLAQNHSQTEGVREKTGVYQQAPGTWETLQPVYAKFIHAVPTGTIRLYLSRLQQGCFACEKLREPTNLIIHETRTSVAKLNPDQLFKGYTFITLKWHEEDLLKLSDKERRSFFNDTSTIAKALQTTLHPNRINYELLGNAMPHLHWHLIPRYTTDPLWGRPIWASNRPRKRLSQEAYTEIVRTLQANLPLTTKPTLSPRSK